MNLKTEREKRTVKAMTEIYCKGVHKSNGLCAECAQLVEYAYKRIEQCPNSDSKKTCAKCTTHCYKPEMREKIKAVMRYAGPRMIYKHPVMAIRHLIDSI